MLKSLLRCSGLLFLFPVMGSEKTGGFLVDRKKSYPSIQKENQKFLSRYRSKFLWRDYIALIDELAKDRYLCIAGKDFHKTVAPDKVVVYFRHDMDIAPFNGLKMAKEEKKRNLRGSYYVLNTVTLHKISQMSGFYTWKLTFSKEQLRKIRKSLRQMRKIHGNLCMFDLDDGIGKELGEKVQIYL